MKKYNLGIDIGGTFIKYAIVDENFKIIKKWKKKSIKFECVEKFYDYICSEIEYLDNIELIGVSAPGLIDEDSNVKSYAAPNVLIMYGTNVNDEIKKRTNKIVATINDAKAAGLCEFEIGNASKSKSSAFLIIGSGTGGCVCDSKGVIYGTDCFAGEFHHLPFINFRTGKFDRMGDYASMTGLIEQYNQKVDENSRVKYGNLVTEKYLNGDKIAVKVIKNWIDNIVVQLLTISIFYNPDIICIGGGISEEDWFISKVNETFSYKAKEFIGQDIITTQIDRCRYNNDANILGAIINVIKS